MDFVYPSQEIRTPPDGFQVQKQLLLGNLRVLLRAKHMLIIKSNHLQLNKQILPVNSKHLRFNKQILPAK